MEIRPSQRVENIKEYYFSTKLKEVAAMKAAGHDVTRSASEAQTVRLTKM